MKSRILKLYDKSQLMKLIKFEPKISISKLFQDVTTFTKYRKDYDDFKSTKNNNWAKN